MVAAALALGLSGCNGYQATSPATARKQTPATGAAAAFAQGPNGPVDCRRAKCVAITFDTGPSIRTPQILSILRTYHVHATFFTIGQNVMKYPATAKAMAAQGNEMETLTWDHQILTSISKDDVRKEIVQGRAAVKQVTGEVPGLLRPPQGRTSDAITAVCRDLGMAEVEWTATASDFETTDPALITQRILGQTKPDGIILLHDHVDPTNHGYNGTVAALPGIISALQAKGYTFVTVSQLLAPGKPQPGLVYK
ncbi:polysaccharide deacetylase family protein [Streptacidiphilus sp. PB12-B1b]|nr:polysaccharide deacetylase family protein [Streptacidiphilus sp. PB12-B1b]